MTAVLQATDALRRDRVMASLDDNQINYSSSSTDWKAKYHEVADMLAETRAELDDFHHSSKELEEELERELERTEKAQQDLKVKVARAETERDEWKGKFMSLQTTHNTTTTSLQRELDTLRQEHQKIKIQLRELEMGNDDLERNERAVTSSLADIESKYSRALEEKILLEHELLDKANLEEDCQRLKDELRDANVEISILKDQIMANQATQSRTSISSTEPATSTAPSSLFPQVSPLTVTDEDLLSTPPPPDMQLAELSPSSESLPTTATPRPKPPAIDTGNKGQSVLLQRAGFQPGKSNIATPPSANSALNRSSTLPSLSTPTRIPPRTPVARPLVTRNPSAMSSSSSSSNVTGTASKSKGVQMVSEMRARVRNLEQKIHTRVPRLRMGSMTGKPNANTMAASTIGPLPTTSSFGRIGPSRSSAMDDRGSGLTPQRRSADDVTEKKPADTSGWVLIMEDSPSPVKDKEKERRRTSSPSAPTAFRPMSASTTASSPTLGSNRGSPLNQSTTTGIRRPQSRLSGASLSTTATTSSIPTPSSRPATPTFLPVPSSGLYAHSSTAGATGLKRSTGPPPSYAQPKRSSLGSSTAASPHSSDAGHRERPVTMPPPPRSASGTPSSTSSSSKHDGTKALPQLPGLHANVTVRAPSKLPSSSVLSQSRIGRPSGGSGRRSTGAAEMAALEGLLDPKKDDQSNRARSGSTAAVYSRNGF